MNLENIIRMNANYEQEQETKRAWLEKLGLDMYSIGECSEVLNPFFPHYEMVKLFLN